MLEATLTSTFALPLDNPMQLLRLQQPLLPSHCSFCYIYPLRRIPFLTITMPFLSLLMSNFCVVLLILQMSRSSHHPPQYHPQSVLFHSSQNDHPILLGTYSYCHLLQDSYFPFTWIPCVQIYAIYQANYSIEKQKY